jgi:adenylate kinase family enzyme
MQSGMRSCRIHVFGASGAGVTTLGRALATALAIPCHDTDDYYWQPTVPPFTAKRDIADRLRLMREMFLPRLDWLLSGALESWGSEIAALCDYAVYVDTVTPLRLARLRAREAAHFGSEAVKVGGWRQKDCDEFVEWASHYDDSTREGRSRARHQSFMASLKCPVIPVDGARPVDDTVERVISVIGLPV